jgi:hypothetical protein
MNKTIDWPWAVHVRGGIKASETILAGAGDCEFIDATTGAHIEISGKTPADVCAAMRQAILISLINKLLWAKRPEAQYRVAMPTGEVSNLTIKDLLAVLFARECEATGIEPFEAQSKSPAKIRHEERTLRSGKKVTLTFRQPTVPPKKPSQE